MSDKTVKELETSINQQMITNLNIRHLTITKKGLKRTITFDFTNALMAKTYGTVTLKTYKTKIYHEILDKLESYT